MQHATMLHETHTLLTHYSNTMPSSLCYTPRAAPPVEQRGSALWEPPILRQCVSVYLSVRPFTVKQMDRVNITLDLGRASAG